MDGWNTTFLLGPGLVLGAFAVSFREGISSNLMVENKEPGNGGFQIRNLLSQGSVFRCYVMLVSGRVKYVLENMKRALSFQAS